MKKIGFLYGKEVRFSQAVIKAINDKNIPKLIAEDIKIGIIYPENSNTYAVILDRFANVVPLYQTAMMNFKQNGTIIINNTNDNRFDEEFLSLSALEKIKINVPKTAVIPSKSLAPNITGDMLTNLVYPLNWDELFDKISFPAQVKSNNIINDFYDCFRVYNRNDFFAIYDMSGSNTLILQEDIKAINNYKVFVIGGKKFIVNYDLFQATKNRYSLLMEPIGEKTDKEIDNIVKNIHKHCQLDVFVLDIAVSDKIYLMRLDKSQANFDNSFIPQECYDWLVEETANLLVDYAMPKTVKKDEAKKTTSTKKVAESKSKTATKKMPTK